MIPARLNFLDDLSLIFWVLASPLFLMRMNLLCRKDLETFMQKSKRSFLEIYLQYLYKENTFLTVLVSTYGVFIFYLFAHFLNSFPGTRLLWAEVFVLWRLWRFFTRCTLWALGYPTTLWSNLGTSWYSLNMDKWAAALNSITPCTLWADRTNYLKSLYRFFSIQSMLSFPLRHPCPSFLGGGYLPLTKLSTTFFARRPGHFLGADHSVDYETPENPFFGERSRICTRNY